MLKLYVLLVIAVYHTSAQRRPPRGYGVEDLPETRFINTTRLNPKEILKSSGLPPNLPHSRQRQRSKPVVKEKNRTDNNSQQNNPSRDRVIFADSDSDDQDFIEVSNEPIVRKRHQKRVKPNHKHKLRRPQRQANDYEPEECAQCLDEKYFKHYYSKGCKPIEGEIVCKKMCPKYFDCPKQDKNPLNEGCEYKGVTYKVNEEIPVPNECMNCRCVNPSQPAISCAVSECFGDWLPLNDSCYRYYDSDKCCSRSVCHTKQELQSIKTCSYDGKAYRIGEKIYPKEDNCITCICDEHWNQTDPIHSKSCRTYDCDFELQTKWKNVQNCVPVYHESTCCPIEYLCPTPNERKCLFDDKYYEIGDKLTTKNKCIDCVCRIPPDFTCIQQKCDPIPTDPNCKPIYKSDECCPKYNCSDDNLKTNRRRNKILPNFQTITESEIKDTLCPTSTPEGLICDINCVKVIDLNRCEICDCLSTSDPVVTNRY